MRKILQKILKILSKMVLKKYKPKIIGITGSVGKTTTKEAIYTVLSQKYRVGKSLKNYNNELGLPLSILGFESPQRNIIAWFFLFVEAIKILVFKDKFYPEILVLEMGIDRPGDMDYLNQIVKSDIGVVTNIGMSHVEYFGSIDKIKKEKAKLITSINKKGLAVINYDNEKSRDIIKMSKERVVSYGFDENSDVRAEEVRFKFDFKNSGFSGINFKLRYKGAVVPIFIEGSLGYHIIYASLVAAVIGRELDMNLLEISEALKNFSTPNGRLKLIEGRGDTVIIDDTYNASPQSCKKALDMLSDMNNSDSNKVVVFGDMLELGENSVAEHEKLGEYVKKSGADVLLVVGRYAKNIARGAINSGMKSSNIYTFNTKQALSKHLDDILNKGDLVLIKGSQGSRMEKIVKGLLRDKSSASEILVRQSPEWLKS